MTAEGNKGIGRLTAIQDASGVIGYYYDERGNLREQLRSVDVLGTDQYSSLRFAYDGANQLTRIAYPDGISVDYSRNAGGQVGSISLSLGSNPAQPIATDIRYLPFGPLTRLTWGNGLSLARHYDQDYQLTQQQTGPWQSAYRHDPNGNITQQEHSLWGSLQYGYDALDRLTGEQSASQKKTYTYDATGNRTQRLTYSLANGSETQTARQTLEYAADSNRLNKRSSSYAVEVDAAGHYTRYSQNRRYGYDDQGRLSTVSDASGVPMASYRYNALGQRTLKLAHSGDIRYPTTYLYGPDGQLLGQVQYSATGKKKTATYWIWLDDLPLAGIELTYASDGTTLASNRLYYLHADHLNTPRLATDANQRLLWSWNSDAFGVGPTNPDVDGDGIITDIPLRFPGQLYDAHSALHYNYFRDYDPETGRYVESDPIGLNGGLNTYGYVEGNPIYYSDPSGLEPHVPYDTFAEARIEMLKDLRERGIKTGFEWIAYIYRLPSEGCVFWAYTEPSTIQNPSKVPPQPPIDSETPPYEHGHNHPSNNGFSPEDRAVSEKLHVPVSVITHDGRYRVYYPSGPKGPARETAFRDLPR